MSKLPPELEAKRDELFDNYYRTEEYFNGDGESCYKAGFDACYTLMQEQIKRLELDKVQLNLRWEETAKTAYELKEREKIAIEALSDTASWLKRMSDLKWDDPSYAPRFKIAFDRHQEALAKLGIKNV